MEISRETKGAFDITIAPLANAWGFGFKKGAFPDSLMIDSLLQITGYEKVKLENGKVVKQDPRVMLSCSAVAKGYSVDVIAQLLRPERNKELYGRHRRRSGSKRGLTPKTTYGVSASTNRLTTPYP